MYWFFSSSQGLPTHLLVFHHELIESISLEGNQRIVPNAGCPDAFTAKDRLSSEAQQQLALQTALSAGYLSKPGALEAVQAQLALHAENPKMVAFYEHYSMQEERGTMYRETQTQQNLVPHGWTGTKRSSARWYDSYTSREWKPWILWNLPHFHELPTLSFRSHSIHVSDSANHFRGPTHLRSITYPTPGQALSGSPRTGILYTSVQSTNFRQLHSHLLWLSGAPTPRAQ
ncbi:hypothetical protein EI94DRAFT_1702077 [Lactarius quietus]|nr:hypothetical protein EI94DRAFT_1702077 [Lactarius quietus]